MIKEVTTIDEIYWAQMCVELYKESSVDIFIEERKDNRFPYEYLYYDDNDCVGLLSLSLRNDYVEGTTTSPVAYIEGIYVGSTHRNRGIARELIDFAKEWAIENECTELASDCEMDNLDSYKFHKSIGFEEVNKIICFKMDLG